MYVFLVVLVRPFSVIYTKVQPMLDLFWAAVDKSSVLSIYNVYIMFKREKHGVIIHFLSISQTS